jgi:hypothetical protein
MTDVLALLLSAAICPAGEVPVEIRALDPTDLPLPGAEIREWSGQEPRNRLLGVTDPDGRATVCVPRRAQSLGVYLAGFVPHRVRLRGTADIADVHLKAGGSVRVVEPTEPPCVTGTAPDGSFRMCSEDIRRLPFAR